MEEERESPDQSRLGFSAPANPEAATAPSGIWADTTSTVTGSASSVPELPLVITTLLVITVLLPFCIRKLRPAQLGFAPIPCKRESPNLLGTVFSSAEPQPVRDHAKAGFVGTVD